MLLLPLLLAAAAAAAVPAPRPAPAAPASQGPGDSTARPGRVTDHVIVISIDGLRPDAIEQFDAATLMRLMRQGSYTLHARTILPSTTLPSHTSMLTGVDADQHGITWNSDEVADRGHVEVPTVFGLAKARGHATAAFFGKAKLHHLEAPNTIDYVRSPGGGLLDSRWSAERTASEVSRYLRSDAAAPGMMFVHIAEPDYAGHGSGWMGRAYGRAVRLADGAVARVIADAEARLGRGHFTVIVTSDHGGHDRGHGSSDPRDTTIPWIAWGEGVTPGAVLPGDIRTMDTAATALWLLGVSIPAHWVGQAIESAFHSDSLGRARR